MKLERLMTAELKHQTSKSLIIGAGAIGSLLGAFLEQSRVEFSFLVRDGSNQTTLKIKTPNAEYDFSNRIRHVENLNNCQFNTIFITVKAFDVIEALKLARKFSHKNTLIICLANGFYHNLLPQQFLESTLSRVGICTFGVSNEKAGVYVLRSTDGKILWGPTVEKQIDIDQQEQFLLKAIKEFEYKKNIYPDIAQKWIFNCTINTISAAQNLNKNIELLSDVTLLDDVFFESYELGKKTFPQIVLPEKDYLFSKLKNLITATGENENSMRRDLREHRKTELEFLAGLALDAENFPHLKRLIKIIKNRQLNLP